MEWNWGVVPSPCSRPPCLSSFFLSLQRHLFAFWESLGLLARLAEFLTGPDGSSDTGQWPLPTCSPYPASCTLNSCALSLEAPSAWVCSGLGGFISFLTPEWKVHVARVHPSLRLSSGPRHETLQERLSPGHISPPFLASMGQRPPQTLRCEASFPHLQMGALLTHRMICRGD